MNIPKDKLINAVGSLSFVIFLMGSLFRNKTMIFSALISSGIVLLFSYKEKTKELVSLNYTFDETTTRYFSLFSALLLILFGSLGLLGVKFVGR